jgi:hypothetical protein
MKREREKKKETKRKRERERERIVLNAIRIFYWICIKVQNVW